MDGSHVCKDVDVEELGGEIEDGGFVGVGCKDIQEDGAEIGEGGCVGGTCPRQKGAEDVEERLIMLVLWTTVVARSFVFVGFGGCG